MDLLCKSGEVFLSRKETYILKRVNLTEELEREAVWLAEISGRTRKVVAEYLGIGLST